MDKTDLITDPSSITNSYIVRLEDGIWLAPWDGSPGRTAARSWATRFHTISEAEEALVDVKMTYGFVNGEIEIYSSSKGLNEWTKADLFKYIQKLEHKIVLQQTTINLLKNTIEEK